MSALERILHETEQWFLSEPLFLVVYCSHRLTINPNMRCALRSGQGRIEYNPDLINPMLDIQLRNLLRVEILRILLKHPYSRQPLSCSSEVLKLASDMVITPAYKLESAGLTHPDKFGLPVGYHFEWYANRLSAIMSRQENANSSSSSSQQQGDGSTERSKENDTKNGGQGDRNGEVREASNQDYASLWAEDDFAGQQITDIVRSNTQWGCLPRAIVELIQKAAEGKIDYRNVLCSFRSSILSQKRHLTRMHPSRRFGFEQMGSRYDFTTRLLVAMDTSFSVSSIDLGRYYHIMTTFFKYGIREIDVLMFDTEVLGAPVTLKDAQKGKQSIKVKGRGGTDLQAPIDYVAERTNYDGVIIMTDGQAPFPNVPPRIKSKLLWVINNDNKYRHFKDEQREIGRVCLMQL